MPADRPTQQFLEGILRDAGDITLNFFQKNFTVQEKNNNQGIVTSADMASEVFIKKRIHEAFPNHDILAEESGLTKYFDSTSLDCVPTWIVDPLDGTNNFSKGNQYYCISIAFGYVKTGRFFCELAGVFQPTTHSLYFAEKKKGASYNMRPLTISDVKNFRLASIATGFSSNKGEALESLMQTLFQIQNESLGVRMNGAAALDLAQTAQGVFQGFYELPLCPWDTAAGALLIEEAGGRVTNFEGHDFCPINDKGIIASNKFLIKNIVDIIHQNCKKKENNTHSIS
jgi:myo-inositol-1(or 4)-monophosphatase